MHTHTQNTKTALLSQPGEWIHSQTLWGVRTDYQVNEQGRLRIRLQGDTLGRMIDQVCRCVCVCGKGLGGGGGMIDRLGGRLDEGAGTEHRSVCHHIHTYPHPSHRPHAHTYNRKTNGNQVAIIRETAHCE